MNKSNNKYRDLCNRIQKISTSYHGTLVDILIQHKCIINENKKGLNKGVSVVMDFVPEAAIADLDKRVSFIENIESQNAEIENARLILNSQNPEHPPSADFIPSHSFLSGGSNNGLSGLSGGGLGGLSSLYSETPIAHAHSFYSSSSSLDQKITQLKIKLYQNTNMKHRTSSSCFWCTLPIEQPTHVCVPTCLRAQAGNDSYDIEGYGSFCRPECAAGYLMHENIETSLKLERYMLLNQIYIPHSDNVGGHGILPAVSPHYVMDKFLGTLSPPEYLKMTEGSVVYTILSKPYTHILPELHDKYMIEQK